MGPWAGANKQASAPARCQPRTNQVVSAARTRLIDAGKVANRLFPHGE